MSYNQWDTDEAFSMLQNESEGVYLATMRCSTPAQLRELWEQSGIGADIPKSKRVNPGRVDWAEVLRDIKGED